MAWTRTSKGPEVAADLCDSQRDAAVVDEQFSVQLLRRMSVPGAQLFGTTNPDSPAHWLKRKYLDRLAELPDWRGFFFRLDDSPALSDDYKAAIRRKYTGLWFRRFILGEWVAAEGVIYDMWNPDEHVVAWSELPEMARVLAVGIDYGTTNATSAIKLGQGIDQRLYLLDEWRHDPAHAQNRLTDAQLSAQIREWLDAEHHPTQQGLRPQWIVADPATASFRVQLHQDGTVTQAADDASPTASAPSPPCSVLAGCGSPTAAKAGSPRRPASWDNTDRQGEDKPVTTADHSLDAGRYAIVTTENLRRPSVPSGRY